MAGCFMTGTDTGVGKTVVTAALVSALVQRGIRAAPMKPIESGTHAASPSDAQRLHGIAPHVPLEQIGLYQFPEPLAPLMAARAAGVTIDMGGVLKAIRDMAHQWDLVVVEGVGGSVVPLTESYDVRALMRALHWPVAVVSRAALGSVNHTLLTLEALARADLPVLGVVLTRPCPVGSDQERRQVESTMALLTEMAPTPILGLVPFEPTLTTSWEAGIQALSHSPPIQALADSAWRACR